MHSTLLADGVGTSAVSMGVVSTYLQMRRARTVSVDGISLSSWYQFLLMGAFWILYGVAVRSPAVMAGSVLTAPMQAVIVARLRPWREPMVLLRATAFIAVCCFIPVVLFGWTAGALGTGVAMVATRFPQIGTLIRHPGDLGVSAGSWATAALCAALWIGYYALSAMWAPFAATAAAMAANCTVCALAVWRHRQLRTPALVAAMA